jgi:hypothetical protein
MCASLCIQHKVNETLDAYVKGNVNLETPEGDIPPHINFL